ncbi:MAG: glycosyltransferase [Prevotellaceae bacterium]|nr:glycosyltransferase [Prevotellaceae bacterium]
MMNKILFVAPTNGNGGIASWAANYRNRQNNDIQLISVGVSERRAMSTNASPSMSSRAWDGFLDMIETTKEVSSALKSNKDIKVVHLTTSGNIGTIRDYLIAKTAKKYGAKTILHCHYGCISADYNRKNFMAWILRKTLYLYDQIWVLDNKSRSTLIANPKLKGKVLITPNFLDVPNLNTDIEGRNYKEVAFVGNLIPSKGVIELVQAVASMDDGTRLHIVGPGSDEVVEKIKSIAGEKLGHQILLYGRVPNKDAVALISKVDIIALPTYYPSEAFPISILEAMSQGKMVISCDRAAIPDMLTDLDGNKCGLLVKERSSDDIKKAIEWCQSHKDKANSMCSAAYEKVYNAYRTDVVLELYNNNYSILINQ